MDNKPFPLEKIFGSRTRIKVISLFTTGIHRPYYVREISRAINERLNAVRRELGILQKVGMLTTYDNKRRKYYEVNPEFMLLEELTSIMRKAGPAVEDNLLKHIEHVGEVDFACATGVFTGVENTPTDILIVGNIDEKKLEIFAKRVEKHLGQEITYSPLSLDEYRYRRNINDIFLRQIFSQAYKVVVNNLDPSLQPDKPVKEKSPATIIR